MNPLKKGGFHLAKNTNTSILPIGFDGAFNFKPKNRFTVRPTKVIIRIGDVISNTIYEKATIDDLIEITTIQLKKLSGETN
jgi:1-acyl-sn-glycerol-3-phosphate acyltransferase